MAAGELVVRARGVEKRFGHIHALRGADLDVHTGEIVAVIGDNGAGKSTLAHVIAGAIEPDAGWIEIDGERLEHASTRGVNERGVEVVYQTLALANDLSIADNIFLGRERTVQSSLGRLLKVLDRHDMERISAEALAKVGWDGPRLSTPVRDLSGGQQQAVAVARAMLWAKSAVIMDEPTAALAARQIDKTNDIIRSAARAGLGVMVITHDIPNVLTYAHRIVVMRRGSVVAEMPAADATVSSLVEMMVSREAAA